MMSSNEPNTTISFDWSFMIQWTLLLITFGYLLHLYWIWKWSGGGKDRLPPGSMGYFGVGENLSLVTNLHKFFEDRHRKYGNIYKTHIMGSPTIIVIGSANLKQIHGAEKDNIDRILPAPMKDLLGPNAITFSNGQYSKSMRMQILSGFKTSNLNDYLPFIYDKMLRKMNEWYEMDVVLVYKEVERLTFEAAFDVIVGLQLSSEEFGRVSNEFRIFSNGLVTAPINIRGFPYHKALQSKRELHRYIEKAIAFVDRLPATSVLGRLLNETSAFELSLEQLQDITVELLFLGHATITSAATALVFCIARDCDVRNKLLREMKDHDLLDTRSKLTLDCLNRMSYLSGTIKETLRMFPPSGGVFRKASKTFQIDNYTIPKDWAIIADIHYTHTQMDIKDKDRFKPERWQSHSKATAANSYLPFGAGSRMCVGREYANMFLRVFAICLLRTCDATEILNENVEWIQKPLLMPTDHLPMRFHARI